MTEGENERAERAYSLIEFGQADAPAEEQARAGVNLNCARIAHARTVASTP